MSRSSKRTRRLAARWWQHAPTLYVCGLPDATNHNTSRSQEQVIHLSTEYPTGERCTAQPCAVKWLEKGVKTPVLLWWRRLTVGAAQETTIAG
jgi:hypothetical protein